MTGHIMSTLFALLGCIMLACRVDKMEKGVTQVSVFIQHAGLALSMFTSAILNFTPYDDWSGAAMAAGIVLFFAFSVHRWRHQAPVGTTKPGELDERSYVHIVGGKRE